MSDANLRIGLVQVTSTTRVEDNATLTEGPIREAAARGAQLVSLPEVVNLVDMRKGRSSQEARFEEEDPCLALYRKLARELGIWIHAGSLVVKLEDDDRMANRAFMIDDQGEIRARYDKIHMFDVDLEGGESYRESKLFRPGDKAVLVDTPWGKIGLTICYDVRFPHLHRQLAEAGARILLNPAAFTRKTGKAHWHTLLTARAIETTCFVAAAAQCGDHDDGRETFGHSLVVSPWGDQLADGGTEPGVVIADLDLTLIDKTRGMVPSLKNGRPFTLTEV